MSTEVCKTVFRVRRCVQALLLAAYGLGMGSTLSFGAESRGDWEESQADARLVLNGPWRRGARLVSIPDGFQSAIGYTASGERLPVQVFEGREGHGGALIDVTDAGGVQSVALYLGAGTNDRRIKVNRPVSVELRKVTGKDPAKDWTAFRYQLGRASRLFGRCELPAFGTAIHPAQVDFCSRHRHSRSHRSRNLNACLAEMTSWIYSPVRETVTFGVDGRDAVFLLVDGALVASQAGRRNPGRWSRGKTVTLSPGLHKVQVFTMAIHAGDLKVGMSMQGDAMAPIGSTDLVVGGTKADGRMEWRGRQIHPDFTVNAGRAFRFGDTGEALVALSMKDATANVSDAELSHEWFVDGKRVGKGPVFRHVLKARRRHRVKLRIRAGEETFDSVGKWVTVRPEAPTSYDVAGALKGIPAVCYERDVVRPRFELRGDAPETMSLDVVVSVKKTDGSTEQTKEALRLEQQWADAVLSPVVADAVASFRWSVAYGGVDIACGRISFLRPPLQPVDLQAVGDMFFNGEEGRCVFVLSPYSPLSPPSHRYRAGFPVVFLDAALGTSVHFRGDSAQRFDARLPALLQGDKEAFYYRDASWQPDLVYAQQSLARVAALSQDYAGFKGTLVLAFGGEAILNEQPVADFERELAALCAILNAFPGIDLILATPPSYEGAEAKARHLAEAVQRVADVQGLEVADIFTAVRALGDDADEVLEGMHVTEIGQQLAAQVFARALSRVMAGRSLD